MSKFTKGKWGYHDKLGLILTYDERGYVIATVRNAGGESVFGASPEGQANARLIAAAPEMYEELIFAMAALRDGDVCDKKRADKIEELLARIDGDIQEG